MAQRVEKAPPVQEYEKWAFDFLVQNLPDDYIVITGAEVKNRNGLSRDCDVLVITDRSVFVVELKAFAGRQEYSTTAWYSNGQFRNNPINQVRNNARIVAAQLNQAFRREERWGVWAQGVVFVTGGCGNLPLELIPQENDLPVYSKEHIIQVLTDTAYLQTDREQAILKPAEKKLVQNTLYDVNMAHRVQNKFGDFILGIKQGESAGLEMHLAQLNFDFEGYQSRYLLKSVSYANMRDQNAADQALVRLRNEYISYDTLKGFPGIPVVSIYTDDGVRAGFALSYPYQKTVKQQLTSLQVADKKRIIRNTADALYSALEAGVISRDLSIENVYFNTVAKTVLLYCFSFSQRIDGELTITGQPIELPPYIAPELIADFSNASENSLVFSLGMFIVQLLSDNGKDIENTNSFIRNPSKFLYTEDVRTEFAECIEWAEKALNIEWKMRPCFADLMEVLNGQGGVSPNIESTHDFMPEKGMVIEERYELIDHLGKGGTGDVWKARHLLGNFDIALKIFDLSKDDSSFKDTVEEFNALRSIYHPNIVREFDIQKIPNSNYGFLTMAFIEGSTLFTIIKEQGQYTGADAEKWFRQVLKALQYIHSLPIAMYHKDIKPDNIMIDENNNVMLVDFGLSIKGQFYEGTSQYICPLQLEQGKSNAYTDLWAVCVSFYELFAGQQPLFSSPEKPYWNKKLSGRAPDGFSIKAFDTLVKIIRGEVRDVSQNYLKLFGLEEHKRRADILFSLPQTLIDEFMLGTRDVPLMTTLLMMMRDNPSKDYSANMINEALRKYRKQTLTTQERSRNQTALNSLSYDKKNGQTRVPPLDRPRKLSTGYRYMISEAFLKRYEELN